MNRLGKEYVMGLGKSLTSSDKYSRVITRNDNDAERIKD